MKKNKNSLIILVINIIIFIVVGNFIKWESTYTPFLIIFTVIMFLLMITIDSVNKTLSFLRYQKLTERERETIEGTNNITWLDRVLSGGNTLDIKDEGKILLEHDYDDIKELDNKLPRWWLNMFYLTIFFAIVYIVKYHLISYPLQEEEFEIEMKLAKETMKENGSNFDINNIEVLTSEEDLKEGKEIFNMVCSACHLKDGTGSIGPNLIDDEWILGNGDIKGIFNTISEGGRAGKGMQSWKTSYSPKQMQKIASYVISLKK